ncbi:hypothetical protein [Candidatus Methylobacter oryzae]|uniref:Uncharacterized protein n=1 Tax=Candidatus Methylobacter oryzae TaxID=2497749 RepID=A0ABY3CCD4_9GAMM|nr:hypothetical protein [Candidatus Methylobacter oryzae]TRW98938.1 hypothetical protein EKO24_006935 [Candidatus Methylobacter oryzae]
MNYKSYAEAHAAAQKIREQYNANGVMVKIETSPYGGYQIKLIPLDLMIDNLSNSTQNGKSKRTAACC